MKILFHIKLYIINLSIALFKKCISTAVMYNMVTWSSVFVHIMYRLIRTTGDDDQFGRVGVCQQQVILILTLYLLTFLTHKVISVFWFSGGQQPPFFQPLTTDVSYQGQANYKRALLKSLHCHKCVIVLCFSQREFNHNLPCNRFYYSKSKN